MTEPATEHPPGTDDDATHDALGGFRRDVDVLLQALPYIQQFRGATVVVKFGGNAMVDDTLASEFARDIVLMHQVGLRPVVVHGGGPQIGAWLDRLGLSSSFVDGRRVTDADTLEVASMVLVGKVNHGLVAAINAHHPVAVGLSGSAAQLLEITPAAAELGFVGQVTSVRPELIRRLLDEDLVPVISTIGTAAGQSYNVNADDVAAAVAESLGAEKLIFLTDVLGVMTDQADPDTLIATLTAGRARALIGDGTIGGGMVPKIEGCLRALDAGVGSVHLVDGRQPHVLLLELLTDAGVGTMLTRT
ncbi:MAG: acetylglutamate kinase [Microthrixaceae bacterium]